MGRTRSNPSTTSTDEKIEVEVAETKTEEVVTDAADTEVTAEETETKTEETIAEEPKNSKAKKFKDNDEVRIKCPGFEGKTVMVAADTLAEFDADGKVTVTGAIANRLLTIPGYELA